MTALLERADQAVSATDMARNFKKHLDDLSAGRADRLVVMRNNAPVSVMVSVTEFEAMLDELEDLRLEKVAAERLRSFAPGDRISHDEMLDLFK